MTYLEMQDQIMRRLNLTSDTARDRIKDLINDRYREVATSPNLARVRRGSVNITVTANNPAASASSVSKLLTVYDPTLLKSTLREVSLDQIRDLDAAGANTGVPYAYAVVSHNASTVTLRLYPKPSANNTLVADVISAFTPLSADGDVPTFPEDFHDLIVDGVLTDEYMKMEKATPLAQMAEARFERKLSDLRYFLAKSAYLRRIPHDTGLPNQLDGNVWPYANL